MTKVPPIPKAILIHTVEYHEYEPNSPYGEAWKVPVTLTNVRVEVNRSMQKQVPFEELVSVVGANLFYCCTNSQPMNITFVEKSKIVFKGREMFINSVDALYALGDTPHHYEVTIA